MEAGGPLSAYRVLFPSQRRLVLRAPVVAGGAAAAAAWVQQTNCFTVSTTQLRRLFHLVQLTTMMVHVHVPVHVYYSTILVLVLQSDADGTRCTRTYRYVYTCTYQVLEYSEYGTRTRTCSRSTRVPVSLGDSASGSPQGLPILQYEYCCNIAILQFCNTQYCNIAIVSCYCNIAKAARCCRSAVPRDGWPLLAASQRAAAALGLLTTMKRHQWQYAWSGLTYTTTAANGAILHLGRAFGRPLRAWFDVGVWAGLALSLVSSLFLLYSVVAKTVELIDLALGVLELQPSHERAAGNNALQTDAVTTFPPAPLALAPGFDVVPLLPGVTVPLSHVVYIWCAAVMSLVVHEAGHALAATSQGVRVDAVGLHLVVLPPVPTAFVQIAQHDEQTTLARGRLRIYYAGVWHNLVLCAGVLAAWTLMAAAFDLIATTAGGAGGPSAADGLLVLAVAPRAAIAGSLSRGDFLTAVNGFSLEDVASFSAHVDAVAASPELQPGFCLPDGTFGTSSGSSSSSSNSAEAASTVCCAPSSTDTSRQCFYDGAAGVSPSDWLLLANASSSAVPRPDVVASSSSGSAPVAVVADAFHCASMADLRGLRLPMCQRQQQQQQQQESQEQPQQHQQVQQQQQRQQPRPQSPTTCPPRHSCHFPVLASGNMMARLTSIRGGLQQPQPPPPPQQQQHSDSPATIGAGAAEPHSASASSLSHTLFIGSPRELVAALRLSPRVPAAWLRHVLAVMPRSLAEWVAIDLPHTVGPRLCL